MALNMPIMLDDISATAKTAASTTYSPKFFDKNRMTGNGKKIGLLSEARDPKYIPKDALISCDPKFIKTRKHHYSNNGVTYTYIPMYTVRMTDTLLRELGMDAFSDEAVVLYEDNICRITGEINPHVLGICEYKNPDNTNAKEIDLSYSMIMAYEDLRHPDNSSFILRETLNPRRSMHITAPMLLMGRKLTSLNDAINDYIDNYCTYTAICKLSERWQTTIDSEFRQLCDIYGKTNNALIENEIREMVRYIEDYRIPLELYNGIYDAIRDNFPATEASIIYKTNLNLLLNDTLRNLEANKAQLNCLPTTNPPVRAPKTFSRQQREAIELPDPLILVQAGAGTGKSTVIGGRIAHMVNCGIKPSDITVLSFTNAAADNITKRNPDVNAMTIASMIHTIYSENYPTHELSSLGTLINSIQIYMPNDFFAYAFINKLQNLVGDSNEAYADMNMFIEKNFDDVIRILDTVRQTSLQLEIIICYQKIDTLKEPDSVSSKYLIIDEVQDNSIFEFIYTLKYINKHRESLFIVGDCSQTLFEFRSANPRALNVLEASGVFTTRQLTVNYRSNQEILDFANVTLANIEANQYARIQLQSNDIAHVVTEDSFTEKVHLYYSRYNSASEIKDAIRDAFATHIYDYVEECNKRGEKVAFVAHTRNNVYWMQELLENRFGSTKSIVNLVPEKSYDSTVFSMFIRKYWDQLRFSPSKNIVYYIQQFILSELDYLVKNAGKAIYNVSNMLDKWSDEYGDTVRAWQNDCIAGRITETEFFDNIKECMLAYEIRTNSIRQSMVSKRNEEAKQAERVANADIILSTIHSAKGLEFDNTVVIYQNKNNMDEEKKRMYYVAFTRAMNSEYIVAFDTLKNPKIQSDYDALVDALRERDAQAAIAATSNVSAQMENDADTEENNSSDASTEEKTEICD